jgi:hypothetical protein
MTHHAFFARAAIVLSLALHPSAASAQHDAKALVPQVPSNLEPPAGHVVYLEARAYGTQNYICLQTATGLGWRFLGPQATLFLPDEVFPQQIATHFLSANPKEHGTPRPTWQSSSDSSLVWGRVAASSTDAAYVSPGAIPWLLVEAAGSAHGPTRGSQLSRTSYILRVNTAGGIAPVSGCSTPEHIGALALVPYSTDYFFFSPRGRR